MFNGIWRDLTFAVRSLAKARAFTLVCVVSLGIGMALVIAIPYWARVLQLPPTGVNIDGLVEVVTTPRGTRGAGELWSFLDFEALRDANTGVAMIGWKGGETKIALETTARNGRGDATAVCGDMEGTGDVQRDLLGRAAQICERHIQSR